MAFNRPRRTSALLWFTQFQVSRCLPSCWRDGRSQAPLIYKVGSLLTALIAVTTSRASATEETFSGGMANRGPFTEKGPISMALESLLGLHVTDSVLLDLPVV